MAVMSSISLSPISQFPFNHFQLTCSTKPTSNTNLSPYRTTRMMFAMSTSTNINAPVAKKKEALEGLYQYMLKEGFELTNTTVEEMEEELEETKKSLEETETELGLVYWVLAHKLQKEGHDPEKVIKYCKKAKKMMKNNEERSVSAPPELVEGWPFTIANVNHLLGCAYCDLKRYNKSWKHLNFSDLTLRELPESDCVLQSLLETWFELYKLEIICGNKDDAAYYMRNILETKEKMMEEGSIELVEAKKDACIAYLADFDFEQALPLALKALEMYAEHLGDNSLIVAQLRGILGLVYTQVGEFDKALEQNQLSWGILRNTTQTTSGLLKGEIDHSDRLIDMERYEEAIEILESVVSETEMKGGERAAIALVSMARAYFYQKKFTEARKYMETALEILEEEEIPDTYIIVGFGVMSVLYEEMNEYETAISLLRRMLIIPKLPMKLFAERSETLCSLISQSGGYEKQKISDLEECVEKLKSAVSPKYCEVDYVYDYETLAIDYMKVGRTESAVKFMAYAKREKDVSYASFYMISQTIQNLCHAYAAMGRYDLAAACQEKAVECLHLEGTRPSIMKKLDEAVRLLCKLQEMARAGDSQ